MEIRRDHSRSLVYAGWIKYSVVTGPFAPRATYYTRCKGRGDPCIPPTNQLYKHMEGNAIERERAEVNPPQDLHTMHSTHQM